VVIETKTGASVLLSDGLLSATFDLTPDDVVQGTYDVVVTNARPDGRSAVLAKALLVEPVEPAPSVPEVDAIDPAEGSNQPDQSLATVTVTGRNLGKVAYASLRHPRLHLIPGQVGAVPGADPDAEIAVTFNLLGQPADSQWTLWLATSEGWSRSTGQTFTIRGRQEPAPGPYGPPVTVDDAVPDHGPGGVLTTVTVLGSGFRRGDSVTLTPVGPLQQRARGPAQEVVGAVLTRFVSHEVLIATFTPDPGDAGTTFAVAVQRADQGSVGAAHFTVDQPTQGPVTPPATTHIAEAPPAAEVAPAAAEPPPAAPAQPSDGPPPSS
jgi:hypothetical protein